MKEKVKRLLDLVRVGKLTLEDAAPLLAALSAKLALPGSDRELVQALLNREDLDTAQIAEHLLLLRGVREPASYSYAYVNPPRPPAPPRAPRVVIGGRDMGGLDSLGDRIAAKVEAAAAAFAAKAERWGEDVGDNMSKWAEDVERSVESVVEGLPGGTGYRPKGNPRGNRILRIEVSSEDGDHYEANIPVSLAAHLHKLVPPYGVKALEKSGFSLDALQLIIEADPPPGPVIEASDENGNTVEISIK